MSSTADQKTGEIWGRREYTFAGCWFALALAALALPCSVAFVCGPPASTDSMVMRAIPWAIGGGVLGALLSVLSIQMVQGSLKQRVRRGLVFEPPVGGIVAFFVYLAGQLGIISFNLGSSGSSEFARWVLLGGVSGFAWDVIIGRVRARIEDAKNGDG